MRISIPSRTEPRTLGRVLTPALALALATGLAGCVGGVPSNRSMNSVNQPVVETTNYTLDVTAGGSGLAYGEQQRLAGWLDAMHLTYGDKIYVDDPARNPAARQAVTELAARRGILISEGAPVTTGYIEPGTVRVILARSRASVPNCPNWTTNSDANPNNGLSSNYGCATNSNLAAMIADPEDLVRGVEGNGETVVMTSSKAIEAYRKATPTGNGNTVSETSSKGN